MIRNIHTRFLVAEGKGQIPASSALGFTVAAALMAGTKSFYEGYYGSQAWADARNSHRAQTRESERVSGEVMESAMSAITDRNTARALTEAHTTSDFPLLVQNIKDRVIRQEYNPVQSDIASAPFVQRRTTSDFKVMQDVRNSALSEIPVRPEGTDVELTTLTQTGDGYRVANYERGIEFTWELFLNDNLSVFNNALAQLGRAANRTRALALFRQIQAVIAQSTLGTAGGPDVTRVGALVQLMADQHDSSRRQSASQSAQLDRYLLAAVVENHVEPNPQFGGNPSRGRFTYWQSGVWHRDASLRVVDGRSAGQRLAGHRRRFALD